MSKNQAYAPDAAKRAALALGDEIIVNGYYTTHSAPYPIPLSEPREGIITHVMDEYPNPYEVDDGRGGWVNVQTARKVQPEQPQGETPQGADDAAVE